MNKHVIIVDGKTYMFYLKANRLYLYEHVNGKFNIVDQLNNEELSKDVVAALLQMIKENIENKIQNNEYTSLDEITKDVKKELGSIDFVGAKNNVSSLNFENMQEYQDFLKQLYKNFKTENEKAELKAEIVEKSLDIDMKEVFERHGITEYNLGPNKNVISYVKNGIPYTLSYSNLNHNVLEMIMQNIDLEQINTEEELDRQIDNTLENADTTYRTNRTTNVNEIDNSIVQGIIEYIKANYQVTDIKGVIPQDPNIFQFALDVLIDGKWEKIFIIKEPGSDKYKVTFGDQKVISQDNDLQSNPTSHLDQISERQQSMEEGLNKQLEKRLEEIQRKLENDEELEDKDKEDIDLIYEKAEQTNDSHLMNLWTMVNSLFVAKYVHDKPKILQKTNNNNKKTDKNAYVYVGLVTFLSGAVTGVLVHLFFKIFIK